MLFINKYQVKRNSDLLFNQDINERLNIISNNNELQNIILYGPLGSGKKTLINLFLKTMYNEDIFNLSTTEYTITSNSKKINILLKQSLYHLIINANTINNKYVLDIINNYVLNKNFSSLIKNNNKIFNEIIIYDFDKFQDTIQFALRRIIEANINNCRFIITCSSIDKIIEPIKSRCIILKVLPPKQKDLLNVILNISNKENYKISINEVNYILDNSKNNISYCLIFIESVIKKIMVIDEYNNSINDLINIIFTKDLNKIDQIRIIINNILSTYISGTKIIQDVLKSIVRKKNINLEIKKEIIKMSNFYEKNYTNDPNNSIHIINLVISIILIMIR